MELALPCLHPRNAHKHEYKVRLPKAGFIMCEALNLNVLLLIL